MSHRNKEGATLALTVTAAFFIMIMGIGLFFLVQLLGGGREAQHATDAGNLNLAEQVMIKPSIPPAGNEAVEFAGLFPSTGNTIDLQDYNKFVGKALLVSLNASEEGTATALTNAQTDIKEVEGVGDDGNGGIGERLFQALRDSGQTHGFFDMVAKSNSLRMLNWNLQNQIDSDPGAYKVAFMRQNANAPTNLQIVSAVIPPGSVHTPLQTSSTSFMVGYTPITVAVPAGGGSTQLTIYGVPVRPNQQPHLVSQEDFANESTSQLVAGDGTSFLPPNAFQSQSNAAEMHGGLVQTRSSAIVGALTTQYPAQLPNGYFIIDNTGSTTGSYNPSTSDPFAGQLMGAGVLMGEAGPGKAVFSTNPSDFAQVLNATPDSSGNIPMSTLNGTNFQPSGVLDQAGLDALHNYLASNTGGTNGADQCNNINSFPMAPGGTPHAFNPNCQQEVQDVYGTLATAGGGSGNTATNLMAIEYLKAEVIRVRSLLDDDGCGTINPQSGLTTGLKSYPHPLTGALLNAVSFGNNGGTSVPSLSTLLAQTNTPAAVITQMRQRMNEMHAEATAGNIDAGLNQPVQFGGSLQYMYWDPSANAFVISTTVPTGFNVSTTTADGNPVTSFNQDNVLADRYIDIDGDGGFPHPFDCPPTLTGFTKDTSIWTPSSGFRNLLGTVKLTNTADVGVTWCCPC